MSQNGSCPVSSAEKIAAVMSALMNTSGGVLVVCIDAARCQKQVQLAECADKILHIITEEEKWIPAIYSEKFINQRTLEEKQEIVFFITKAMHFVTHSTNAYHCDGNEVKPLQDYDSLCTILRGCSCTPTNICDHHHQNDTGFTPAVVLNFEMPFSTENGRTCIYRYYPLQDRSLRGLLRSSSVKNEIKKIVSALANGNGGSLFLGVTDADPPIVKGYAWNRNDFEELQVLLSDFSDMENHTRVSIWSNLMLDQKQWEVLFHPVSGCRDDRIVIEVRVQQCTGGMFCAMPVGFVINASGEISFLTNFWEWKDALLQISKAEMKENVTVDEHLEEETEIAPGSPILQDTKSSDTISDSPRQRAHVEDTGGDKVFQWWATHSDDVITKSYSFHHCCARDLAEEVLDTRTPFTFFPSAEAVTERNRNLTGLKIALLDIADRYKDEIGAGVIIEHMDDPSDELSLISEGHHVYNIVILRQNYRPALISIMWTNCESSVAKQYSTIFACHLKRLCLLTYGDLCDRNPYLCFERHVYRIGKGFEIQEENVSYPQEYLIHTPGPTDIVRYTLAAILLRCEPLVDRFGNIMVRHLSACQAKSLFNKLRKVTLVESKAGSGKSVLALETMRRINNHQQGKNSRIVFLCRGRGLASFMAYQTARMKILIDIQIIFVEATEQLNEEYFSQYTDIFIDDAHAIPLQGIPNCRSMYRSLFSSLWRSNSHAYIFLDPEMQDYRGCIPKDCTKQIRNIALRQTFIKRQDVRTERLEKILRNSRRVCQFIQANFVEDVGEDPEEIQGIRNLPEDGIFFFYIQKNITPVPLSVDDGAHQNHEKGGTHVTTYDCDENDIFGYLPYSRYYYTQKDNYTHQNKTMDDHLSDRCDEEEDSQTNKNNDSLSDHCDEEEETSDEDYPATASADHDDGSVSDNAKEGDKEATTLLSRLDEILKHSKYHEKDVAILTEGSKDNRWVRKILKSASYIIQGATIFPATHIVVDTLENFEGLESPVILFIVPKSWGSNYIGSLKYRLCIATRAISRLEFLVPRSPNGRHENLAQLRRVFGTEVTILYRHTLIPKC